MRNKRISDAFFRYSVNFENVFNSLLFRSSIRNITESDVSSAKATLLKTVMDKGYMEDVNLEGKVVTVKNYPFAFLSSTGTIDDLQEGFEKLLTVCNLIVKSLRKQKQLSLNLESEIKTDIALKGEDFDYDLFIRDSKVKPLIDSEIMFLARAINEFPLSNNAEIKVLMKIDDKTKHIDFKAYVSATKVFKDIKLTADKDQLIKLTEYFLKSDLTLFTNSIPFYGIVEEVGHDFPSSQNISIANDKVLEEFDFITANSIRSSDFLNLGFDDFKYSPLDIYKLLIP